MVFGIKTEGYFPLELAILPNFSVGMHLHTVVKISMLWTILKSFDYNCKNQMPIVPLRNISEL